MSYCLDPVTSAALGWLQLPALVRSGEGVRLQSWSLVDSAQCQTRVGGGAISDPVTLAFTFTFVWVGSKAAMNPAKAPIEFMGFGSGPPWVPKCSRTKPGSTRLGARQTACVGGYVNADQPGRWRIAPRELIPLTVG